MAQGKTITDKQIETIKATFAMTGSLTDSAHAAGCSLSTAKKYAGLRDDFEALRREKRVDIIAEITVVQVALLAAMRDPEHLRRASVQEIGTAFGIVTDKSLLLTGQATSRVETGAIDPGKLTAEEREAATRIRAKLAGQTVDA